MNLNKSIKTNRIFLTGGCLLPSFFICSLLHADTVTIKNGKDLKGLVVEQHADRIILSTENGEIPILRSGIKGIAYDDPEQSFLEMGKAYEAQGKLGEALGYYEKALEIKPGFNEALSAVARVRNRYWALSTEGPKNEVEKRQILDDFQSQSITLKKNSKKENVSQQFKEKFGATTASCGDWVCLESVEAKKALAMAGLKRGDRLVFLNGQSLRYLAPDVVSKKLIEERTINTSLEYDRTLFLSRDQGSTLKDLGFRLKLEYQGLLIAGVSDEDKSPASEAGFKNEDLLTHIDGVPTRYMPIRKAHELIEKSGGEKISFTLRRKSLVMAF